jgi:hypothetical protein
VRTARETSGLAASGMSAYRFASSNNKAA